LDREEKWRWDWLERGIRFEGWDEGFGVRDWLGQRWGWGLEGKDQGIKVIEYG